MPLLMCSLDITNWADAEKIDKILMGTINMTAIILATFWTHVDDTMVRFSADFTTAATYTKMKSWIQLVLIIGKILPM